MSRKPSGHAVKCGCYTCIEHRRNNARRLKHEERWAERELHEALAEYDEEDRP